MAEGVFVDLFLQMVCDREAKQDFTLSYRVIQSAFVSLVFCWIQRLAYGVVLFDANLGTPPSEQGWPFFPDPLLGHSVTEMAGNDVTVLDSRNPITDRAGYFSIDPLVGIFAHPNVPSLNRQTGYSIAFEIRIQAEHHADGPGGDDNGDGLADRAGFSLSAISSDIFGVELSFWEDRIWIKDDDTRSPDDLFTQAEGVSWDTTADLTEFELQVMGSRYRLRANSALDPLLSGPLRDYRRFEGPINPYETPNFLFFGDNSKRAEAAVEIARISAGELAGPCAEVDLLIGQIVAGTHDAKFDMNGDTIVNETDLAIWRSTAGEFYLGEGQMFLAADVNLDGVVDGSDFNVWNQHRNSQETGWCAGDLSANGQVDADDFDIWFANRFLPSVNSQTVPEAVNVWWLLIVLCPQLRSRRGVLTPRKGCAERQPVGV